MPINAEDKALVHSHTGQTRRLAKTDLQRSNHENQASGIRSLLESRFAGALWV